MTCIREEEEEEVMPIPNVGTAVYLSSLLEENALTLASSIVMTRLDYCNSLIYMACQNMYSKRQTSGCAEYTGSSGHQVRCMDSSSTSSSETPLIADQPKNIVQTGNADLEVQSTSTPQYRSSLLSVLRSTGY